MHRLPILILVIFLGVVGIQAGEEQQEHHPQPPQDPRFEFLKSLEGTWTGPPLSEGMPDGVFEFHVTAGGHAVEEREMIGTPMEMVTLYHMRGKDLIAKHYCMLGNRPQLKASRRVVDQTLSFACAGIPGNAASHDEEHVHGWRMRLGEDGQLHYSAELVKDGKVTEAPDVVLTRSRQTASR